MPCRSYEDDVDSRDNSRLRAQVDRLARVACAAMRELERQGTEDFVLLQNEELRQWWEAHKIADAKAAAEELARAERRAQKEEAKRLKEELKARALAKLDPDEIKALGVKL